LSDVVAKEAEVGTGRAELKEEAGVEVRMVELKASQGQGPTPKGVPLDGKILQLCL
jgi:hypothetical protein